MGAKLTSVRLSCGSRTQVFEVEHAERLLRMPNNGGWKIAADEKVELTENGFKPVKDKRRDTKAE